MEQTMIPDSVLRMESVQAAVATAPEFESVSEFMSRVKIIYGFLSHTTQDHDHEAGVFIQ